MSLTVWDASSSRGILALMLVAVAIFLPLILAYTAFAILNAMWLEIRDDDSRKN
jgi:cytochrome d ubiquinol oxidase subunit II